MHESNANIPKSEKLSFKEKMLLFGGEIIRALGCNSEAYRRETDYHQYAIYGVKKASEYLKSIGCSDID